MIEVFRDVAGPCLAPGGSVVAVGAFDGLHCGHRALLRQVRDRAAARGLTPAAVSFEPLPRAFFTRAPMPRLGTPREKIEGFASVGVRRTLLLRFDRALSELSAEDFIRRILVQRMGVREVWVGEAFRFGHQRRGDVALLRTAGVEAGFETHVLPPVHVAGVRASSTRIRELLAAGDFGRAGRLLGRPFAIEGHVAHGAKLGRTLGFPTANLHLGRRISPVEGVFAVRVEMGGATPPRPGVASLGTRPTVNGREPLLEAHLFDFDGDLYGRRIKVVFVTKLRDEEKFADLDALTTQMHADAAAARRVLNLVAPVSP